jgi:hypothetical protein
MSEVTKKPRAQRTQRPLAPQKLKLLFTIVNRQKAELYMDLLQSFDVNMQLSMAAHGTANSEMLDYLGLVDTEKVVIISVIRNDKVSDAMKMLEEKFNTIKNGKGIAYTVPMTSTIGVAIYQFLCNNRTV